MSDLLPTDTQAMDSGAKRLIAGVQKTDNGTIGHVLFNLPEKHNVIDLEGWQAIAPLMQKFAAIENMRLLVLRGVGGKAFVAGADIAQFEEVLSGPEGTISTAPPLPPLMPLPLARYPLWQPLKAIALAAAWALPQRVTCAWRAPIAVSVFLPANWGLPIRPMPHISWHDWSACRKPSALSSPPPI